MSPKKGTVNQRRRAVIHRYSNGKTQTNFSEPKKLNYSENNMEISTFELLAKPIAPLDKLTAELLPVARRIVQGYFLTISNLEAFSLVYRIEFTISKPVLPNDPNRTIILGLNKNVGLFVDVAGDNNEIPLTQNGEVYSGSFKIPARQTASVELLPILPTALAPAMLEVRGFVSLFSKKKIFVPAKRYKVLLNPEIRGTFLPNDFATVPPSPPNPDLDFDQINYTLALASGKALNEIIPEKGFQFSIDLPTIQPILEQFRNGTLDLASLEAEDSEKAKMLVQLLAEFDPDEVNFNDLNTVLEKLDIAVRMSNI